VSTLTGNKLLRLPAVARILDVSESCVRDLVKGGLIPSIRVGRAIRVPESRLNQLLENGGAGGWRRKDFQSGTRADGNANGAVVEPKGLPHLADCALSTDVACAVTGLTPDEYRLLFETGALRKGTLAEVLAIPSAAKELEHGRR
jgi:excisionase family DNA binding protein